MHIFTINLNSSVCIMNEYVKFGLVGYCKALVTNSLNKAYIQHTT